MDELPPLEPCDPFSWDDSFETTHGGSISFYDAVSSYPDAMIINFNPNPYIWLDGVVCDHSIPEPEHTPEFPYFIDVETQDIIMVKGKCIKCHSFFEEFFVTEDRIGENVTVAHCEKEKLD